MKEIIFSKKNILYGEKRVLEKKLFLTFEEPYFLEKNEISSKKVPNLPYFYGSKDFKPHSLNRKKCQSCKMAPF